MAGALVQAHLLLLDEMEARQAGERKTRELAILLARAEAAALRAQIRPHFLFNTLNTIHSLVREDPAAAEETIERFSDLLRGVIQGIDRDCWCLGRELDLAEAYLAIERMRHGDRLRCTVVVDEEARRCDVPVFSLQPLVENAVQHAVEESPEPTTIRIEAEVAGGRLEIRVTDDGPGLLEPGPGLSEPEPGDRRHAGFGLAIDNIRERLRRLYGAEAGLELSSPGRGVCATLTMPRALTAERQGSST
jgi:sensor histidine kinase YesM